MDKHAYLIMTHNDFYILEKLLKLIDDERNDIYLHIDKKAKNFNLSNYKKIVKKSNLYQVKRTDVRWGDYSQINCELLLLEEATKRKYAYYHLLSGVDLPLSSQNEIHEFFSKNTGYEFVGICEDTCYDRVKYYHFFVRNIRKNKFAQKIHFHTIKLQEKIRINRLKKIPYEIKKGPNWFSITNDFACYIVDNKKNIKKYFKKTLCADEIFLQTLLYNSKFKNKVYNINKNDNENAIRMIDWERGKPYTFTIEDYNMLSESNMFFARKFSTNTKEQKKIVDKIYNTIKKKIERESNTLN